MGMKWDKMGQNRAKWEQTGTKCGLNWIKYNETGQNRTTQDEMGRNGTKWDETEQIDTKVSLNREKWQNSNFETNS